MVMVATHLDPFNHSPRASFSPEISPKGLLFPPEKKKKKNVSINNDCNDDARWYWTAVAIGIASMNIGGGGGVGAALSVELPVAGLAVGLGDRGSAGGFGGGVESDIWLIGMMERRCSESKNHHVQVDMETWVVT